MADRKAENVLRAWDDLLLDQRVQVPHWQELADYIQPRKNTVGVDTSGVPVIRSDRANLHLFDSTAPHANELLAASMQGALTSSAFRWFALRIRGVELSRDHQVNVDLEACAMDMYQAINESNFASESHELYLDSPCFGISAMLAEERQPTAQVHAGALRHKALAVGSYLVDEDEDGHVDKLFRQFNLTARAAARAFGVENVGRQVQHALETNASLRFNFIHAIYPREDAALPMGNRKLPVPAKKLPWASLIIDVTGRKVSRESGYHEKPFMVPRWNKRSGEMYGYGPGSVALGDIKTLNKAVELKLKAWAKVVDPAMKARHEGIIGNIDIKNGGVTYVRDMDALQALTEMSGRLDVADMEEEKTRQAIRRMFYSDQLQLQEGPQMTAYEVQVRYELMQRILGPTLGRLNVEFLNPYIERVFWIRLRASAADSPYRRVWAWCRENNVALDIEYEGPLAKAQRLQESVAMQRFFQVILPVSQVKPEVLDNIDWDAVVRLQAISIGVPSTILVPPAEMQQVRAARTQAMEQQAQLQQAEQAAGAAGAIAPLVKALADQGGVPPGAGSPVLGSG